jgi:hypothetical protein
MFDAHEKQSMKDTSKINVIMVWLCARNSWVFSKQHCHQCLEVKSSTLLHILLSGIFNCIEKIGFEKKPGECVSNNKMASSQIVYIGKGK